MTACVNKHSKRVAAVISASLVGALSLGVAVPAFAAEGIQALAESLPSTEDWQGVTFDWSVEKDEYGKYTVQAGEDFTLESATYADGITAVNMADVTVFYVKTTNTNNITGSDNVYTETQPNVGNWVAFVYNGKVELPETWKSGDALPGSIVRELKNLPHQAVEFRVAPKSLVGAYAYQGDDVNDTTFQYTGYSFNDGDTNTSDPVNDIHFADAAGNPLTEGSGKDYTLSGIRRVSDNSTVTNLVDAGKYIATLVGQGEYAGSSVDVEFTVRQIDLANDAFTVNPIKAQADAIVSGDYNQIAAGAQAEAGVYVNGEKLSPAVVAVSVVSGVDKDGNPIDPATYNGTTAAALKYRITDNTSYSGGWHGYNFVDDDAFGEAEGYIVTTLVNKFFYDGETVREGDTLRFETAKGEAFDRSAITAVSGRENVACDVTVYKDGEVVTDYSQPGTYTVQVSAKTDPATLEFAGTRTFDMVVVSKRFSEQPKVYASVNGKDAKNPVEYDAKAVTPKVVAKAGSAVLTEGEDYTVSYTDSKGNAVEEIVEPDTYTATVDFGNAYYWKNGKAYEVQNVEFTVTVAKATVETAKADQDLYSYIEDSAIAPTFTAYTKAGFKGLSTAVDPATDGATYYEVVTDAKGKPVAPNGKPAGDQAELDTDGDNIVDTVVYTDPMTGSELTETGWYVAEITVPNADAHFKGSVFTAPFEVSSYAVFSDVDANAWYAQDVYKAAQLGYMTGISGTDLFMPEAEISRAELSKVFANMAGHVDDGLKNPTQFDDVDPVAWYAEPIAWASEAGIVTGYDDTTFGPMDKATREQVAVMLYRYAKNQGKDVSVENADETLAAYKDGDQVSDWAREAMAWAVENGVFGQNTDELWAKQNIKRDAVATIAVRFQPEALPEA